MSFRSLEKHKPVVVSNSLLLLQKAQELTHIPTTPLSIFSLIHICQILRWISLKSHYEFLNRNKEVISTNLASARNALSTALYITALSPTKKSLHMYTLPYHSKIETQPSQPQVATTEGRKGWYTASLQTPLCDSYFFKSWAVRKL